MIGDDRVPPGWLGGPPWKVEDDDGQGVPPKFQEDFTKKWIFIEGKSNFL